MRRLTADQRLSHKFLVGANQAQYNVVMAESMRKGVAPMRSYQKLATYWIFYTYPILWPVNIKYPLNIMRH